MREVLGLAARPSRAPGRSARCRSAPASCAGSTRASRGCRARSRGPSPCRRPSASPSAASRPPRRSTSATAQLPMLALIFTRKSRPMIIGSSSGWLHVGRDDRAAARDLGAHELGLDALARGDEGHLLGDDARAARSASGSRCRRLAARDRARRDPRRAQRRQPGARIRGPRARACRRRRAAARRPRGGCGARERAGDAPCARPRAGAPCATRWRGRSGRGAAVRVRTGAACASLSYAGMTRIRFEGCFSGARRAAPSPRRTPARPAMPAGAPASRDRASAGRGPASPRPAARIVAQLVREPKSARPTRSTIAIAVPSSSEAGGGQRDATRSEASAAPVPPRRGAVRPARSRRPGTARRPPVPWPATPGAPRATARAAIARSSETAERRRADPAPVQVGALVVDARPSRRPGRRRRRRLRRPRPARSSALWARPA